MFGLNNECGFLATRDEWAVYADSNLGKHKVPTLRNVGLGSCESLDSRGGRFTVILMDAH